MRILVVGAYGLIGGYVTQRLLAEGHEVVGVGRDLEAARRRFPSVRWVRADLRRIDAETWAGMLEGVEAVVNCAGALQDGPRDDLAAVHVAATRALAEACAKAGVRRLVMVSAVGVDRAESPFERTKLAAEEALQASGLDWVILRPGLVLAPAAYGGSGLLRGLAALPLAIPAARPDQVVQVVSIEDVAEAAARSVRTGAPSRLICDLVSPERTRLRDVLLGLRAWLGLAPAPVWPVPMPLARLSSLGADALAWLGWRSPMRTASLRQLAAGVEGDPGEAERSLGLRFKTLGGALAGWPAGVQERWYARLYFLKFGILVVLAGFWAASGVIGLARIHEAAALLTNAGLDEAAARTSVLAGSLADLALAALVSIRRTARPALLGMVLVTLGYLAAASLWLPGLWADPLGPLVKSIPAAILALVALAIMDER
jgi:uncharacterized protein YbjT (DUF2867 family)